MSVDGYDARRYSNVHVQTASNPGTLEGLGLGVLLTEVHETGHLVLSELNLLSAKSSKRDVGDLVVRLIEDGSAENKRVSAFSPIARNFHPSIQNFHKPSILCNLFSRRSPSHSHTIRNNAYHFVNR